MNEDKFQRMRSLVASLVNASMAYHMRNSEEMISDKEYDEMCQELKKLEEETGVLYCRSPHAKYYNPIYPDDNLISTKINNNEFRGYVIEKGDSFFLEGENNNSKFRLFVCDDSIQNRINLEALAKTVLADYVLKHT